MVENIGPVLIMVFVPALVMKLGPGITHKPTFRRVGAAISLAIADTGSELLRAVSGKVIRQPLPV